MLNEIAIKTIELAVHIYTLLMLLRLVLQMVKADFYNPISQFIVKATNPVLMPLRKFIPGFFGIDFPAVVIAVFVQIIGVILLQWLSSDSVVANPFFYLILGIVGALSVLVSFYLFAILILVVISWVAPGNMHPGAQLLAQLTEPVMRPVRNLMPDTGGLDFSPMIVLFIIWILQDTVLPGLKLTLSQMLG